MKFTKTTNENVALNWSNGIPSTNNGGCFTTDGDRLWSYNTLIGVTSPTGSKILGDFTASGGEFLSMTTSTKHISNARRVATTTIAPDTFRTLVFSDCF